MSTSLSSPPIAPPTPADRKAERRATRRAENRTEVLDAAERVFGQDGLKDGSMRRIAAESGFSTAAIYIFFENKQDLVVETLGRRGGELIAALSADAALDLSPIDRLHQVVDTTIAFFAERPHFAQLLRHLRGNTAITGPVLAEFDTDASPGFDQAMTILASIITEGQHCGEIRAGNPRALAHLYSVLVNEYILLGAPDDAEPLTLRQFHGFVDGALRPRENDSLPTAGAGTPT
jgi:AcrR family transcriptional regulator